MPALSRSLSGPQPKAWWYLARASGLVAYALLSASMLLGLLLSTRFAKEWPGNASAFALHEQTSLLGLAFGLFHSLVLLGDRHTPFTIAQILLPFGAVYRPFAVGLGQLAVYGMTLVAGTFYVRRHIGRRAWRLIHFGTFAVFALALLHGLGASSDRTVMAAGIVPALLILFFGTYRTVAHLAGGASPEVQAQ
jgi:predicted ferric reductase